MLNQTTLQGRLTRDPEMRRTASGTPVASFTLAIDRDFAGKTSGVRETDFINCVAWRGTAEFVCKHFHKGRMMLVNGRLQSRTWTDNDGDKHKALDVVAENVYFAGDAPHSSQKDQQTAPAAPSPDDVPASSISDFHELNDEEEFDDEVPF